MKRAVLYLRPSKIGQTTEDQERGLRAVAERIGCEIVQVYKDHSISGARDRNIIRPAFDELCRAATRREFELVIAWSVDRIGRNVKDLVSSVCELHSHGIDMFLHQGGLDISAATDRAMFQKMLVLFLEFEKSRMKERVTVTLASAKADGKRLGRPPIAVETERAIRAALEMEQRPTFRRIAATFGVGMRTISRLARELPR
jgi:DNA invertase Pin-like site-specific DNA recombinase